MRTATSLFYLAQAEGNLQALPSTFDGTPIGLIAVADGNSDGKPDLLSGQNGQLIILIN
jgi:hypothetical protein